MVVVTSVPPIAVLAEVAAKILVLREGVAAADRVTLVRRVNTLVEMVVVTSVPPIAVRVVAAPRTLVLPLAVAMVKQGALGHHEYREAGAVVPNLALLRTVPDEVTMMVDHEEEVLNAMIVKSLGASVKKRAITNLDRAGLRDFCRFQPLLN